MGVTLFEILPGTPPVFQCSRLRAAITPQSCAKFHSAARYDPCVECPIGAAHAKTFGLQQPTRRVARESTDTSPAPLLRLRCVRCERPARRLIGPHLCASCFNRQRETLSGVNAKGTKPCEVASGLHRVAALVEGQVTMQVGSSVLAPEIRRVAGGALIQTVATGRAEVERWLAAAQSGTRLVDIEVGPNLAVAYGWPPSPRRCRRRAAHGRAATPCEVS